MRVFVTGASGFVGSAVVRELIGAGHQVLGLARSDAGAEAVSQAGAAVHRGELTDHDSLVAGAKACEGVIHTAFIHDFSKFEANVEIDRLAVEAMIAAMEGSNKPFVVTTGTALVASVAQGRASVEADTPPQGAFRAESETMVLTARGVRGSVIRLSPTTHGAGDHGFVPRLIDIARAKGFAAYVGDGANRWPAVHRLDAARLYRLALEKALPGTRLHAVAEQGVSMRAIQEAIGAGLGIPVRSLTDAEAAAHFEWFVRFVALDAPASSAATQDTLGWRPEGPELLKDMRESGYFA